MKASLAGIFDRGILDKERVHFRADSDLDLSFFVLLSTHSLSETSVSAGNLSAYWFSPRAIKRGQHVVVYTRAGTPSTEAHGDGGMYHFIFRGLVNPLYALPNANAVLMEVATWVTSKATYVALPPLPANAGGLIPTGLASSLSDLGSTSSLGGLGQASLADFLTGIPKPKG
jgi:hypothetical protein